MRGNQKVVAAFLTLLLLAVGLGGKGPGALAYVNETCKDTIDNDVDGTYGGPMPLVLADFADGECVWMPQTFGNGEYDGLGLTDPTAGDPDVNAYVSIWNQKHGSDSPTHFEIIQAAVEAGLKPGGLCTSDVQNALSAYKNTFNLPNDMTGANEHMNECGVSY